MDYRARRFWLFAGFLALAPAAMYIVYDLRTPDLCEGDELQVRNCRWCGGSGKWAQEEGPQPMGDRCPSCGGTGKVRVIVPGDKRPTRIRGAVVDAATVDPWTTYDTVRPHLGPPGPSASYGGRSGSRIGGAKVTFVRHPGGVEALEVDDQNSDAGELEAVRLASGPVDPARVNPAEDIPAKDIIVEECTPQGMFNRQLPPGRYAVTVEAPGFQPVSGHFVVRRLTEPIWLEEATTVYEPGSGAEAQSNYGLHFLAALSRQADAEGWIQVNPGTP
jgi:hypothetical protein